jgi:transmembrane sensor
MMNPPSRIQELAHKWMTGAITPEERTEFMNWYNQSDDDQPLDIPKEFATDELSHSLRLFTKIFEQNKKDVKEETPVHHIHSNKKSWIPYAAAILIILAIAGYLINTGNPKKTEIAEHHVDSVHHDMKAPLTAHAVITLGNGNNIILDSLQNGVIATLGKVQVVKLSDGHLIYKGASDEITYNTLMNPRGSKVVNIILADGTKVWLNSESSLRYPTAFTGSERMVEVTGETYFEVAKNSAMPFRVKKGAMLVTVLGTHFNVNTYEEEGNMAVTLLEGSVQVSSTLAQKDIQLRPGEQSQFNQDGHLTLTKGINTDDVVAWKNGKFQFGEKSDIGSIMRMLARWYDIEVEYQGTINRHFGGTISSDVDLSQVLKVLETTGDVKFKVSGNKVIVMP